MVIIIKKSKKSQKNIENFSTNIKIIFTGVIATLGFIIVCGHLAFIQFAQGKELSEKGYLKSLEFSWKKTCKLTYDAYLSILNSD